VTRKELSRQHEEYIAKVYDGKRSRSSGAAASDKSDVRTSEEMIECKLTGELGKPKRTSLLTIMEKAADEAWSENKEPVVCLRLYNPDSPLANTDGWVDFTVRLTTDDVRRAEVESW
jgi:hypothetical protein